MLILDILLQIIGAFYMFAAIVLVRAVLVSRLVDGATAAITGGAPRFEDAVKERFSLALAVATFLCGLALLSMCDLAAYLFVAVTVLQAAYLFWIAPRYIDPVTEITTAGRRQSINAFIVFCAVTSLVIWATTHGRLQPVAEASDASLVMTAAIVAIFLGYIAWMHRRTRLSSQDL